MKTLTTKLKTIISLGLFVLLFGNLNAQTYTGDCAECATMSDQDVFSDAGGFITTCGMLNKKFYEICWAGTHNSFANNYEPDVRTDYVYNYLGLISTKNHDNNIKFQLETGVRMFVFDLIKGDNNTFFSHGTHTYGKTGMEATLIDIKEFLDNNPKEILIISLSFEDDALDWYLLDDSDLSTADKEDMMADFYDAAVSAGLWDYVSQGDAISDTSNGKSFSPDDDSWPTLQDMINDDQRVVILPKNDAPFSDYCSTTNNYKSTGNYNSWKDFDPDIANVSAPSKSGYTYSSYTIYVNPNPGDYSSADRDEVERTNEAVILYELGVEVQNELATLAATDGNDYHLTYFQTNFYQGSLNSVSGKRKGLSVVDACNRINYDRFAYSWSSSIVGDDLYWDEMSCFAETAEDLWSTTNLDAVRADTYGDWGGSNQDLAVNDDYFDNWTSKSKNGGNDWDYDIYFDLGTSEAVKGITFNYNSNLERVKFYGSNDKSNWSRLLGATDVSRGEGEGLWQYFQFDENLSDYRYINARLDKDYSSSKNEVKIYDVVFLVEESSTKSGMISQQRTENILQETVSEFQFVIYPNPSNGKQVSLQLSGMEDAAGYQLDIMDMSARIVYQSYQTVTNKIEQLTLNDLSLSSGIYVIRITGDQLNESRKLVVK